MRRFLKITQDQQQGRPGQDQQQGGSGKDQLQGGSGQGQQQEGHGQGQQQSGGAEEAHLGDHKRITRSFSQNKPFSEIKSVLKVRRR